MAGGVGLDKVVPTAAFRSVIGAAEAVPFRKWVALCAVNECDRAITTRRVYCERMLADRSLPEHTSTASRQLRRARRNAVDSSNGLWAALLFWPGFIGTAEAGPFRKRIALCAITGETEPAELVFIRAGLSKGGAWDRSLRRRALAFGTPAASYAGARRDRASSCESSWAALVLRGCLYGRAKALPLQKRIAVLRTVLGKAARSPSLASRTWGHRFVAGLGLILPFYELFPSFGSGAIGLLILFWGMQYAWKAMAAPKVDLDGSFAVAGC